MASYENIHYGLRPAKQIERKMLCESFRKLAEFGSVQSYRYIGFGSIYFSDFAMFHKALGITDMISIERDVQNKVRFEFNRPFRCIKLQFGESNTVLPTLDWSMRTILWLDYDGTLDTSVLADVSYFCANAHPGSMILVSVNAYPVKMKVLEEHVGENKIPSGIEEQDLTQWGTAITYRKILFNEIGETLAAKNGGRPRESEILYRQLFNFHYSDNVKMMTCGGIIVDRGQIGSLSKCAFSELPWYRDGETAFHIDVPMLTYRELRYLDTQLPISSCNDIIPIGVPTKDLEKYFMLYRHFPNFTEADL